MNKSLALCLVFMTILTMALVGKPGRVRGEDSVAIGVSLALSGRYSTMGNMQLKGFRLWEDHINRDGGLLGRQVRLLVLNDQSQPEKARENYRDLLENHRVDLLFGPYSSAITEKVLPVTEKAGQPLLISGAAADRLWAKGYQRAFGVYNPASKYAVGFLMLLLKRQIRKICLLGADDSFSASLARSTRGWAQRLGLQVVFTASFPKGTADLNGLAARARAAGARAVLMCGHLAESVNMRRAMAAIKWQPAAYYASVGPATEEYGGLLGPLAEGTFSSSLWEEASGRNFPGGEDFVKDFRRRFGVKPSYHAATAYAAGMILATAISKNKSLDKTALARTLSDMDTMTVIGRYGVDRTGRQIRHFALIVQWRGGRKLVVWPKGLAQAQPVFGGP